MINIANYKHYSMGFCISKCEIITDYMNHKSRSLRKKFLKLKYTKQQLVNSNPRVLSYKTSRSISKLKSHFCFQSISEQFVCLQ